MRVLREALSFDEDEIKKLKLKQSGDVLKWDGKAGTVKNVEIGETMMNLIVKELKDMDETDKLTDDHITLFEKFVENPKEDTPED